jgi:hypothetical protein
MKERICQKCFVVIVKSSEWSNEYFENKKYCSQKCYHASPKSKESLKKMSESRTGKLNHFYGKKHSKETKEKLRVYRTGLILTDEHKKKISKSLIGNKRSLGYSQSEETRNKKRIAAIRIGSRPPSTKGRIAGPEERQRKRLRILGINNPSWKGGITPINRVIRTSKLYKLWRQMVFQRDNFTCVWCGAKDVYLNADHIKPFAYFPELRFYINNGRTLCVPCHKKTDTYGNRKRKI